MTLETLSLRVIRAVARAFPGHFQQVYGPDLEEAAAELVRHHARRGNGFAIAGVVVRVLFDLLVRLIAEHWVDWVRDTRHAARGLVRSPGFTIPAVLCLAIGIGVVSVMYTQIQSMVIRPLPQVRDASGVVRLERLASFPDFRVLRDESGQFASAAAFMAPVPLVLSVDGAPAIRVWAHLATPEYFEVLGVPAALGRVIGPEDRTPGAADGIVLSYDLWQSAFGSDPGIVGRRIRVNGYPGVILGVAAAGFLGATPSTAVAQVWVPATAPVRTVPELRALNDPRDTSFTVIGRLAAGRTVAEAEQGLDAWLRRLEEVRGDPRREDKSRRARLLAGGRMFPVRDDELAKSIGFPFLMAGLVFLMACGNVANMLLARGMARAREMAVRLSLGAGPGRIARQQMAETLLLAVLGAAGGVLLAIWFSSVFSSMRPMMPSYVHLETGVQWRSLSIAILLAGGAAFLTGLVPALRAARIDVFTGLRSRVASASRRRWFNLRNVLVFQQVAASMVLLLLTAFIVFGWRRSAGVDLGFDSERLYLVSLDPYRDGLNAQRSESLLRSARERLRATSGVSGVSVAQTLPLVMSSGDLMINAKVEFATGAQTLGTMRADHVGEGFFQTMGARLRAGREFTRRDETDTARVLVVNETLARLMWPAGDAVGQRIDLENESWEVVGVVSDLRSAFPLAPATPAVYRPATPSQYAAPSRNGVTLVVRVQPGFDARTRLRQVIEAVDPSASILGIKPMTEEIDKIMFFARLGTFTYGGMGLFGLILASVGLTGVTAFAVARRTHEIGIRMALGATRSRVLALVLKEGGWIVAAGTLTGWVVAFAVLRALSAFVENFARLTNTTLTDPLLLAGVPLLLAVVAMLSCYVPARRGTQVDPAIALRAE